MKQFRTIFITGICILLSLINLTPSAHVLATQNNLDDFSVAATAAIAVDFETGKILYEQNIDEPLGIASMTKLITAYLVFEAVHTGKIAWDDPVPVSDQLIKMSKNPDLSNIPLDKKKTYTVKNMLDATLISSANATSAALAELISGSEPEFVDLMRAKLKDWGIDDAYIITSSGLGNEDMDGHIYPGSGKTDENMLSARSMAIISQRIIKDYPEVLDITKKTNETLFEQTSDELTYWSSNYMLPGSYYYMEGVDGLKTGTTELAGVCFTGTIDRNGHRLITVVMDVDDGYDRFLETSQLMTYAYDNWSYEIVGKKGDAAVVSTFETVKGKEATVSLVLDEDLKIWTNHTNSQIEQLFEEDNKQLDRKDRIVAPKDKNYYVGEQSARDKKDQLGYLTKQEEKENSSKVNVVTKTDVAKANVFLRFWHTISNK